MGTAVAASTCFSFNLVLVSCFLVFEDSLLAPAGASLFWLRRLAKASMAAIRFLLICLLPAFTVTKPQYSSSGIPANVLEGLPSQTFYQPEKSPNIPILPGERRCDNYYNGEVMPCLCAPGSPPSPTPPPRATMGSTRGGGGRRGHGELCSQHLGLYLDPQSTFHRSDLQ